MLIAEPARSFFNRARNAECLLLALLYGPAARCKPKMMIWKVGLAHLYPAYSWSL
jgi:hypothetical protein